MASRPRVPIPRHRLRARIRHRRRAPYPPPPQGSYPPPPHGSYPPPPPMPYGAPPPPGYYGCSAEEDTVGIDHRLGGWHLRAVGRRRHRLRGDRRQGHGHRDGRQGRRLPQGDTRQRRVLTVDTVGCDESHAGEVFAVLLMPEGRLSGAVGDRRVPEQVRARAGLLCTRRDHRRLGAALCAVSDAETWEQGDRAVTCVATLDPPRAGSLKG